MKPGADMKVCAVIPAFNAEETIQDVLLKVQQSISREHIIVVDDGSADATCEKAESLGVTVVRNTQNRGKGYSLNMGFDKARVLGAEAVLTLDADGQHDPACIDSFIDAMKTYDADLVMGSRAISFSEMPFDRVLSNFLSSLVVSFVSGMSIADSQCGFRLINIDKLNQLFLKGTRYELETELLIQAVWEKWNIIFCPVPVIYNGSESSISRIRDTARFCRIISQLLKNRYL